MALNAGNPNAAAASGMAGLGVPSDTVERVLNHSTGKLRVTHQVYDHAKEKAAALLVWEDNVLALVEGRTGTVVAFGSTA